ncbi:hypothetical protein MM221_07180 [Salipaludibacillus sp. LMS25]|uniref:hypothetical protein n=1 Tax=Salipaludibacillus sp. LMS25 TaxID=2924031 RepID=UPI0020CFFAA8|nr:hypothetical protein [Salipaludibacillus sp. LMS25]UTR16322.1 hypothetical protein MM221_07180 [Salipaludibacillus sp. LMS25]
MFTWIKDGKGASLTLFLISILVLSISFLIVAINDLRDEELTRILNLLETDGIQAYAVFGLIALIFLGAIIAHMFFVSVFLHLILKVIFRIPMAFDRFFKIMKVFYIFIGLGICWQLIVSDRLLAPIIFNPFIIVGFIVMYFLFRFLTDVRRFKPFLFTTFLYGSCLVVTKISSGSPPSQWL